jgi:uncharacterized protein (DUF1778 family)
MATRITNEKEKEARLNVRLRTDLKDRIEKAANISGKSITDFAVSTLIDTADEIIERHHTAKLSDRDRDIFLTILDKAAKPNQFLRRAGKTHKKIIIK